MCSMSVLISPLFHLLSQHIMVPNNAHHLMASAHIIFRRNGKNQKYSNNHLISNIIIVHTISSLAVPRHQQGLAHGSYLYLYPPSQPKEPSLVIRIGQPAEVTRSSCSNISYLCTESETSSVTKTCTCIVEHSSTEKRNSKISI